MELEWRCPGIAVIAEKIFLPRFRRVYAQLDRSTAETRNHGRSTLSRAAAVALCELSMLEQSRHSTTQKQLDETQPRESKKTVDVSEIVTHGIQQAVSDVSSRI